MNGSSKLINDQNHKAQLAAQFNEFYLQITSPNVSQIGNYRIIEEIGEGAFGKVYLASHVLLNVKVVLKCGLVDDPNIVREIYYHKQLKHKNIVTLYEVIKTENHLWIVLEYCEGSELFFHIYEKRRLDVRECQALFFQVVLALKYVHSLHLSHRDLKLENILLADKRKTVVKLTDFGFVREFNPQTRKFLCTVCGTTVYMAPELLKNEKYSGFAIDIWSLGVILYTMLYGEMPFDEDDDLKTKHKIIHEEPRYRDSIPPDLVILVQGMLAKDPSKRTNLNQILNSPFLIDLYNKHLDKTSRHSNNDAESVLSINQHYRVNSSPFQTKIEKDLVKRLQKLNFNTDELQACVLNNQMNSLTAFYELSLTKEFSKKKRRYYREKSKRYFEAKKTLQKSRNRVKSALSLSDLANQPVAHPLEKIKSGLSISSMKNSSKTNLHRISISDPKTLVTDYDMPDNRRITSDYEQRRIDSQLSRNSWMNTLSKVDQFGMGASSPSTPRPSAMIGDSPRTEPKRSLRVPSRTSLDGTPLERTVSFHPESIPIRRTSVPDAKLTKSFETFDRKSKNAKFLNKLMFWKSGKRNGDDNESLYSHARTYTSTESGEVYGNKSINENEDTGGPLELVVKRNTPSPKDKQSQLQQPITIVAASTAPSRDNILDGPVAFEDKIGEKPRSSPVAETSFRGSSRTRPSSMISQMSQISQISQMSTMLSESELDNLDETDTMEEDYDDEDGIYEASLNTSQDFQRNLSVSAVSAAVGSSNSKLHTVKNRPSYRRTTSSEQSIKSTSTTTTTYKHQKKFSLSQLSNDSSEESSIKSSNAFGMPIPTKTAQSDLDSTLSQVQYARSSSPELIKKDKRWQNPIFVSTSTPAITSLIKNGNVINSNSANGTSTQVNGMALQTSGASLDGPYKADTPFFRSHSPPVPKKFNKLNNKLIKPVKTVFESNSPSSKANATWYNKATQTAETPKKVYQPVINEEEESDEYPLSVTFRRGSLRDSSEILLSTQ